MNEKLASPLTPREYRWMQEKLLELLSSQARRYTRGESTSIPAELAQRLLDSICYCLGISSQYPDGGWKCLLDCDLTAVYQRGMAGIEEKKQFGRRLWQGVCANLPPVENTSMLDTLKSIGGFWERYDSAFFAHEVPCEIDYQLALPVPESFLGIDYVVQYLENLSCENQFLSEYSAEDMTPILRRYCPDHRGLPVDLFEPVVTNAMGLAVLGEDDAPLRISEYKLGRLYSLFENMSRAEIQNCLLGGVDRLKTSHPDLDSKVFRYISRYCEPLAARIDLLRDCNGLNGVFMTI